MRLPPLLLFDMDGVLADVTHSYREAILATAHSYLRDVLGAHLPDAGVWTAADVDALKRTGGFNNDWDAAAGLVQIAVAHQTSVVGGARLPAEPTTDDAVAAVSGALSGITLEPLPTDQIAALCARIAGNGGGLRGLGAATDYRGDGLTLHHGAVTGADLITRIFQEHYLGSAAFAAVYGAPPRFVAGPGLAERETLLVPAELLAELARHSRLGIATGRPRQEAELFLQRHGIASRFETLVTEDEVAAAEAAQEGAAPGSLRKPHPWPLLTALAQIGEGAAAYLGDTPDDLRAARAANGVRPVLAVGCLWACPDPQAARAAMLAVGADALLVRPEQITAGLGD
ncbi:MAG: HAD hydrolase-like protein [Chloroflexi bacterium]|nr:HAD hydrolase-like protein [Chloroflexota bacterium]